LRNAVERLNFNGEQRVKYFASATHQEIMRGALNPPPGVVAPEEHVFAYMRIIRNLPENIEAKDYIDLSGDTRDPYSKKQLKKLRVDLEEKLPEEHIYEYKAEWKNGCAIDDIEAFGERIYMDLQSIIERQLEEIVIIDPLAKEVQIHEEFKKGRIEHFTGRVEALKAISDYLGSNLRKIFSLIGPSGTGKTSLMAKAIENVRDIEGVKILRFIGTTSFSSDTYKLLFQLISHIVREYGIEMNFLLKEGEDEEKLTSVAGLREIFTRCLNLASGEKPLFIFLDALDQLSIEYASMPVYWLPEELPENVKIIVSALSELKERLSYTVIYEIKPMSRDDGNELLDRWLTSISRRLQPNQKEEVLKKFTLSGNPLYLRLAFEKAKEWYSYKEDTFLKEDIDGILEEYFEDLEGKHGSLLVQKFCGYTLSGKYQGLTETEFLGLSVFDKEYWDYFIERCHPSHREEVKEIGRLPVIVWSRLFLDMEPYLTEKDADGVSIISFYHRKFNENSRKRFLKDAKKYHTILADYFEEEPLYLDEQNKIPNVRKVVELPYQEIMAEQWEDAVDKTLSNFSFLMAKAKAWMVDGILEDYGFASARVPQETKERFKMWEAFFGERVHILRRGNNEWPAYKILLQLAIEHADDSPLTNAAEDYVEEGSVEWIWLRRTPRLMQAEPNPCLLVLEGHNGFVEGAIELHDGRILSWAQDKLSRIWDSGSGRCLSVLEGNTSQLKGAIELHDGRILSWAQNEDKPLRIWDSKSGRCLNVFEGHSGQLWGAIELHDGRILSWGDALRIWDSKSGRCLSVLEGNTSQLWGAIELHDGRILSWGDALRIWDSGSGR
jgi:GTPase SAR1 family protein